MQFIFPKPTEWNAFEEIVCDVFARKYQNLNLQRYGRSGQRQYGVDIAGFTQIGLLGVQCKHHPKGDIQTAEIDAEVTESEKFSPRLTEYIIATSADRDAKSYNCVLELAFQRKSVGSYPVTIKYWEDICNWLAEYPDLVYKHFTKFYPHRELERFYLSALESINKESIRWPCAQNELIAHVSMSLSSLPKNDPYLLALGFTTFNPVDFVGKTDLNISLADIITSERDPVSAFSQASRTLNQIKLTILNPYFSKRLLVYPQARLSYALLFGWTFRRVTGFDLLVAARQEIWPSEGLILTPSMLADDYPITLDSQSEDVAVVLNISRDIKSSVAKFIESWDRQPKAIVSYRLEGGFIASAAHALSVALDINRRIKNLVDNWGARRIHLFGALPAALAILIGHHLNAICPLDIYFLDESRDNYQLSGTITNSL
jgi:hypothetical protein